MRATIKEVAKAANCSITAVSFVFNGKEEKVSSKTRNRILEIARELDYRPNKLAAGLAIGKTKTIGVIIPDNRNPFFGAILSYVEEFADNAGYRVIAGNTNDRVSRDLMYLDSFLSYCTSGIIIVRSVAHSKEEEKALCTKLLRLSIPVVAIDRIIQHCHIPTFLVDNRLGGYLATKHLLELGHRKIGCYTGPLSAHSALERLKGYKEALSDYGCSYYKKYVYEGSFQLAENDFAFSHFVKQGASAVFAHNDMQAYEIYKYAQINGRKIPDDFSVVGFDDLDFSTIITPSLTSIKYPLQESTCDAVQCLIDLIDNDNEACCEDYAPTEYAPELVIRGSTCEQISNFN